MKLFRRGKQRGSAMLEFAVGATVFVALFTGTFQYGYSYYVYNNLETAVRVGVRYASLRTYPLAVQTADSSPSSDYTTAVRNVVIYGDPAGAANGARPVAPGLAASHVLVSVGFSQGQPATVTVSIHNYNVNSVFGNWNLNRKPSATFTFLGTWAPPT